MTFATLGFAVLIISLTLQAVFLFRQKPIHRAVTFTNILACLLFLIEMVLRSLQVGYIALLGTYDSLIFYAAVLLILLIIYDRQKRFEPSPALRFGASVIALALVAIASSPIVDSVARPPIPALRSGWLVIHVALSFIGEAFFAFF